MSVPGVSRSVPGGSYDAVIVGAGIQGLALAYELALRGMGRIAVLDAHHPGYGASGRNGELIRSAFSSREWIGLFDRSLRRWPTLSAELDFNTLFTRAGYLILASTEPQLAGLRADHRLQGELGLQTELLDAESVRSIAPELAPELVAGGLFQAAGGFAHHDAAVWGYAAAAARAGVEIHAGTRVVGVRTSSGRVEGVRTSYGEISTDTLVNAAGGFARELAAMAGVDLPTRRGRLEMLVTESVQPFLRPSVASLELMGYCHQTSRGEFAGGTEFAAIDPADTHAVTLRGLRDMATKFVALFPRLAGVRVTRHWAGLVDQTPDLSPVLGPAPELAGFHFDCGWTYGFMGAPGAAELLSRSIVSGRTDSLIAPFAVERLRTGKLIREGSLVVPSSDHEEVA